MVEGAGVLGWLAGVLLVASFIAWLKMGRGPLLRKLNGDLAIGGNEAENASRLLALAAGFSIFAAALALLGLMFG